MDEQALTPSTSLSVEEDFDQEDTLMAEYRERENALTKLAVSDGFDEVDKILAERIEFLERGKAIDGIFASPDKEVGQAYKACLMAAKHVEDVREMIKEAGESFKNAGPTD